MLEEADQTLLGCLRKGSRWHGHCVSDRFVAPPVIQCTMTKAYVLSENSKTGPNDRPVEDVVIADCGELEIDYETDAEGNQVPVHAEL